MEAVLPKTNNSMLRELFRQLKVSGIFSLVSLLFEIGILWFIAHWGGATLVGQWIFALALGLPIFAWGVLPKQSTTSDFSSSLQAFLIIQISIFSFMSISLLIATLLTDLSWTSLGIMLLALAWLALRQWGPAWKQNGKQLKKFNKNSFFDYKAHWQQAFKIWKEHGQGFGQVSLEWLILALPIYGLAWQAGWEILGYFAVVGFWLCTHRSWIHPHWLPGREYLREAVLQKRVDDFERMFLKQLGYSLTLFLLLLLLVSLFGGVILEFGFGSAYARFEEVLVWMVAAGGLWFVQGYMRQARLLIQPKRYPLWDTVFWLALEFFFVLTMIPHLGLSGAAWSLFFLALLRSLTQTIRLERALKGLSMA